MKLMKIAAIIIILCIVVFLSVSCSSKSTTTVKTQDYTVQKGSLSVAVTGTGNLAFTQTQNLPINLFYQGGSVGRGGTIGQVLVQVGDTVQKGQVLVSVDPTEWANQLLIVQNNVTTAQRNVTNESGLVTDAQRQLDADQRAVITAQKGVTAAQRQVDLANLAVTQAQVNVQSANSTLNSVAVVATAKDAIDTIRNQLILGASGDTYWATQKDNLQKQLAEAIQAYNDLISGTGVTLSTDVALLVAQKVLALTQAQYALVDAQTAVNNAMAAVDTAQQAVDDANYAVTKQQQALVNANADLSNANSSLADAQKTLADAQAMSPEITAPFDGFVTALNVAAGDNVYNGTIAVTVADPNKFEANILVSEDDIFSVKLGGDATVSLSALSDLSFPAKVTKISPTPTVSSGVVNYSVTVNITSLQPITATQSTTSQLPAQSANRTAPSGTPPTTGASGNMTMPTGNMTAPRTVSQPTSTAAASTTENVTLKDGLSATVSIISQQKSNVLIIPSKAITRLSGNSTVQVVKGSTTETRTIQTGITDGTYTEVSSGLSEGEQVQIKTGTSSTSSSSTKTPSTQQQLQSISGGGPSGGPPPGGF